MDPTGTRTALRFLNQSRYPLRHRECIFTYLREKLLFNQYKARWPPIAVREMVDIMDDRLLRDMLSEWNLRLLKKERKRR